MNRKRTLLAVLMAALLVFAFAGVASAADLSDEEIATKRLMAIDVVKGDPDGNLRLDDGITRAEFAAIVIRLRGMEGAANASKGETQFPDVKTDAWYTGYINLASGNGIIKGYPDGNFRPNDPVNYAEAAAMLVRVLGYEPAVEAVGTGWPNNYLSKAGEKGILDGVDMPNWRDAARRGDVFTMTDNALDVNLMEQKSYGTEVKYEEVEGKNLLNEYLNVDVYDKDWADDKNDGVLPKVTHVPMFNVGNYKDNEIKIKGITGKLKVAEWINPDDFMGQSVEVWVHDNETVLYLEQDKDETTKVDKIDGKFKNNKVTLDEDGDDYKFTDDAIVYVNGVEKDLKVVLKGDYDGAYIKVVLNDDDEVTYADIREYNNEDSLLDETYVVDEVDDDYIYTFNLRGQEDSIKLKDADYRIVKDGVTAKADDLDRGDVLVKFEFKKDEFYLEVITDKVAGEIEDYYAKNADKLDDNAIVIDGERHYFAAKAFLADEDYDRIDELDADDVEDLVGASVTALFNPLGDIVALVTSDDVVKAKNFGVIVSDATPEYRGGNYTMTIMNTDGKKLDFTFDPEDVDLRFHDGKRYITKGLDEDIDKYVKKKLEGFLNVGDSKYIDLFTKCIKPKNGDNKDLKDLKAPVAIKYSLNSKGELKQIDLLSGFLANNDKLVLKDPDYDIVKDTDDAILDKYDDVIYIKDKRTYYNLDKNFVAFNLTKGVKSFKLGGDAEYYELHDPKMTDWDSIKDKKLKFGYFVNKDKVEAVFVYGGDRITSDILYAMVDGFTTVNGEKGTILLTPDGKTVRYEGGREAPRRSFVAYKIDGDEIDKVWILAYKDSIEKSLEESDLKALIEEEEAIEEAVHGYVVRDSGNRIEVELDDGSTRYFTLQSDAVRYNLPDGEIVNKVNRDDYVLLIDTDDDGIAIDYVVVIKEDAREDDSSKGGDNGDDNGKEPETVTYIVKDYTAVFGRLDVEDKYGKKSSLFVEDFDGWVIGEDEVPVEVMLAWLAKNIPNEDSIIIVVEDNVLKVEGEVTEHKAQITGQPILNEEQGGYFVKLKLSTDVSDAGLKVYSVNSKKWLTVHPDSDNNLNIWFRVADVDGNKLEDRDGDYEWFVINDDGVFKVTFTYDSNEITIPEADV